MAVTPTTVKALGDDLSGLSDAFVQQYIDIAECLINEDAWGDCGEKAKNLMAAHLSAMGARGGVSGQVTSKKVADLQKSYSTVNSDGNIDMLAQTSYGVMLYQLRRATFILPFCV